MLLCFYFEHYAWQGGPTRETSNLIEIAVLLSAHSTMGNQCYLLGGKPREHLGPCAHNAALMVSTPIAV